MVSEGPFIDERLILEFLTIEKNNMKLHLI